MGAAYKFVWWKRIQTKLPCACKEMNQQLVGIELISLIRSKVGETFYLVTTQV
jgi:hypothetical protein